MWKEKLFILSTFSFFLNDFTSQIYQKNSHWTWIWLAFEFMKYMLVRFHSLHWYVEICWKTYMISNKTWKQYISYEFLISHSQILLIKQNYSGWFIYKSRTNVWGKIWYWYWLYLVKLQISCVTWFWVLLYFCVGITWKVDMH